MGCTSCKLPVGWHRGQQVIMVIAQIGEITMHALMMIHSGSWQVYIVSRSHHKMYLSEEFPGGITNGASWYPIYGGMQDWNYIHAGCFELTLEISDNKWPNASELATLWEYNKMSLLNIAASLEKLAEGLLITIGSLPPEIDMKLWPLRLDTNQIPHISLGEAAMDLDFILDPEVKTKGNLPIINDCSCESKCNVHQEINENQESEWCKPDKKGLKPPPWQATRSYLEIKHKPQH
ncbi:hypothetical protein NC652_005672 [Populus alba x Populus x berolinensis]|nr:hypothetical protein NC652_005672 [Populus alba x Populus x berolinensis]